MRWKRTSVSLRQAIFYSALLLAANFIDMVVTKLGFSLGYTERGIAPAIASWSHVWHWKWLVCFTLIVSLFAVWRKPKIRWFFAQLVFGVAFVMLFVQFMSVFDIAALKYCEQILVILKNIQLFVRGLLGQS